MHKRSTIPAGATHPVNPAVVGLFWAVLSAVSYSATNICLRFVAGEHDPIWVACLRATPSAVVSVLLCSWRWSGGRQALVPMALFPAIFFAALMVQVAGNVGFQFSLSQVGLAVTVPVCFGVLIVTGAALGRILLSEPISGRSATAMALLIVAVAILGTGARRASEAMAAESHLPPRTREASPVAVATAENAPTRPAATWAMAAAGVVAASFAGAAYANAGVVIRKSQHAAVPLSSVLLVMSGTGTIVLGVTSLIRIGPSAMLATNAGDLVIMLLAGSCNAVAFYALGLGLARLPVVFVNVVNASQAAIAAVAGVMVFGEPLTAAVVGGAGLTVVGIGLLDSGARRRRSE